MSFRRFVYLVTDDRSRRPCNFSLRRIDMSRFFLPKAQRNELLTDPPPLEEAKLPPAEVKFDPPTSAGANEDMEFMLFPDGGSGGNNDKVVVSDLTGRVLLYDTESRSIRSVPSLCDPKFQPVSMAVGNSYYVLDTNFTLNKRAGCFDCFAHDDDRYCYSLPPPPYVYAYPGASHVDSCTVVGSSNIWISSSNLGTHCFDMARHVWTKAGNWILPFWGHVQYVPEHKLWFGIQSSSYGCDEDDGSICASDLTVTPPTIRKVWGDLTPPEWTRKVSFLVHLGNSKFCHARFFKTKRPVDIEYRSYVVFTGMEAELCGNAGGELRHSYTGWSTNCFTGYSSLGWHTIL